MSTTASEPVRHLGTGLRYGDPVPDRAGYQGLPVGCVVAYGSTEGTRWEKTAQNAWTRTGDQSATATNSSMVPGMNYLVSIPDTAIGAPTETFAAYKARFVTHIVNAARAHNVRMSAVNAAFDRLGLNATTRRRDVTVGTSLRHDEVPPDGTVATYGDPSMEAFSMYRFREGRWSMIVGHYPEIARVGTVVVTSVPESAAQPEAEAEPEDVNAAIAEFKSAVWREGWRAKTDERWCSAYERILGDFGITQADGGVVLAEFPRIPYDEAVALPDGALVASQGIRWQFLIRDRGASEEFRQVASATGARINRSGYRMLWDGAGQMNVPLNGPLLMPPLPVGSQVCTQADGNESYFYTKRDDGRWQHNSDVNTSHRAVSFGSVWVRRLGS